jgi:hypothetical protein
MIHVKATNATKASIRNGIISFLLASLAFVSFYGLIDDFGERYADASFKRALLAFGIARGLNAAISVAQGTEIALEPAGVGVILAPGQILDPVNDLIERFSWVMLACTTSLGIQGVLLKIFSSFMFSTLVAIALAGVIFVVWKRSSLSPGMRRGLYRALALLVILRFFIPFMAISSEGLYQAFLAADFEASTAGLQQTTEQIDELNEKSREYQNETRNRSWIDALSDNIDSAIDSLNINKRIEQLEKSARDVTEHTINLIVLFTLQTILFPILFLWLAMKLVRVAFSFRFD